MKNLKYILVLIFFIFIAENKYAYGTTVTGTGCATSSRMYISYLGTSSWYGTTFDVYNSNGQSYLIDANNASQCNVINNNNVQRGSQACWINTVANQNNNMTGVTYGTISSYTLETCSGNPPDGVPLDDYIWVFACVIASLGAYMLIRKRFIH